MIQTIMYILLAFFILILTSYSLRIRKKIKIHREYLRNLNVENKFGILIPGLEKYFYKGSAILTRESESTFRLQQTGSGQTIDLIYGVGIISMTWKYESSKQKLRYRKIFSDLKDSDEFWQIEVLTTFISEVSAEYNIAKIKKNKDV